MRQTGFYLGLVGALVLLDPSFAPALAAHPQTQFIQYVGLTVAGLLLSLGPHPAPMQGGSHLKRA